MRVNDHNTKKNLGNQRSKFLISTQFLTLGMWIIGIVVVLGGLTLLSQNSSYEFDNPFWRIKDHIIMFVGFTFLNIGNVFVILRRESPRPGLPSIKGIKAVLLGTMGIIGVLIFQLLIIIELCRLIMVM